MFAVLDAAAEYELELRAERQAEGIAAARPKAACCPAKKHIGRPGRRPGRAVAAAAVDQRGHHRHPSRRHPRSLPFHRLRRARQHTLTRRKVPPATRRARDIRRDGFGRAGSARRTPDFSAPGPGVSSQTVIARRSPTRDIRRSAWHGAQQAPPAAAADQGDLRSASVALGTRSNPTSHGSAEKPGQAVHSWRVLRDRDLGGERSAGALRPRREPLPGPGQGSSGNVVREFRRCR